MHVTYVPYVHDLYMDPRDVGEYLSIRGLPQKLEISEYYFTILVFGLISTPGRQTLL